MTFKLYTLKATVTNERYDGRKKYGIGAIKEFEIGTSFSLSESKLIQGEPFARHPATLVYKGESTSISRELELLLLSVSAEAPMVRWSDAKRMLDPFGNGWLADDVLEALVARGIVEIATLYQFADDIYNSEE